MKKMLLYLTLSLFLFSCGNNHHYKEMAIKMLETNGGVRTDKNVKFTKFEMFDITVGDSIRLLNEQYELEKQRKIEVEEQKIQTLKANIERVEKENKLSSSASAAMYKRSLLIAENELKMAQQWSPAYLKKYDGRDKSELLCKVADAYFSYDNHDIKARQEMGAYFYYSPSGNELYGFRTQK